MSEPQVPERNNKLGRPSRYTAVLADRICELIGTTPGGLHAITDQHPEFPAVGTIMRWLSTYPEFREKYVRARETQADLMAYEQLRIADTIREGQKIERKEVGRECSECGHAAKWLRGDWRHTLDGSDLCSGATAQKVVEEKTITGDMVERARLQIDARKWLAGKLAPRVYGDRQQIDQRLVDEQGKDRPFTRADYDAMVRQAEKEEAEENGKP
jgi:hypothetical protein